MAEARAKRYSGRPGQRFETLTAVRKAVRLARDLGSPESVFAELRNLAVAGLALPDQHVLKEWEGWPEGSHGMDFDPVALRLYARGDKQGNISVRRLDDDEEVARLEGQGKPRAVTFGADGRSLLLQSGPEGTLERWTIGGGTPRKLTTVVPDVCCSQQSRDGRRLLVIHRSRPGTRFEVLDCQSGRRCFEYQAADEGTPVLRAGLSPDGRWLALADHPYGSPGRRSLLVFDVDSQQRVAKLDHDESVISPTWHPDSRTLAIGGWSLQCGLYLGRADASAAPGAARSERRRAGPDHESVGASAEQPGLLGGGHLYWHPHTGKVLLRSPQWITMNRPVQDGRLYDYFLDKTRITLHTMEPSPVFRTLAPDTSAPQSPECRGVAIHPAGRLLAIGHANGVSLVDLPTGVEVGKLDLKPSLFVRFDPVSGDLVTYGPPGLFRWPVRYVPDPARGPTHITVGPPPPTWPGRGIRHPARHQPGRQGDCRRPFLQSRGLPGERR